MIQKDRPEGNPPGRLQANIEEINDKADNCRDGIRHFGT